MSGEMKIGRNAFLRALGLAPFQLIVWMVLAASYMGKNNYKILYRLLSQNDK
jgi:hypothetical protein